MRARGALGPMEARGELEEGDDAFGPGGETRAMLRSLVLALPVAAFLMDRRGRVLSMSREAEARLRGVPSPRRALEELADSVRRRGAVRPRWLDAREALIVRPIDALGSERLALVSLIPSAPSFRVPCAASVQAALSLSAREAEVALLAAQGFSALNIACRLGVAESTVRTYLKRLYQKTGVCSRAELACRVLGVEAVVEADHDAA